jgi:hypothetical protein
VPDGLVRSNKRWGAWCAIFALAIQFVLSFGHVHADGFIQAPGIVSSFFDSAQDVAPDTADKSVPRKHVGFGHYCATCAAIHAGGLLPTGLPAPWPLPVATDQLTVNRIETILAGSFEPLFQARAPPFA